MVKDLSDPVQSRRRMQDNVRRTNSRTRAQSTSVDRGRFAVKSEEGFVIGTPEDPTGTGAVYGELDIVGILRILGQLLLAGNMEVTTGGSIKVGGVLITPLGGGKIQIGDSIVLDAATQTISINGTAIRLTAEGGGKIQIGANIVLDAANQRLTIGTGTSQIVLDLTKFKVGPAFKMDPAHSTTGAQQEFGTNGRTTLYGEDAYAQITKLSSSGAAVAWMRVGTVGDFTGVSLAGDISTPSLEPLPAGHGYRMIVRSEEDQQLYTFTGGMGGGPGDGIFAWPYPLAQVTSEFGMRVHPITGVPTMHDGIDFGIGPSNTSGTPIPSAGSGIATVGFSSGYGNFVIVDHGIDPNYAGGGHNIKTRYAHMVTTPAVANGATVTLGQTLGGIGSTGSSTDEHLHFEVLVDGVPVNPRTFMAAHGG